jgi:hypothetical protein
MIVDRYVRSSVDLANGKLSGNNIFHVASRKGGFFYVGVFPAGRTRADSGFNGPLSPASLRFCLRFKMQMRL